MKIRLLNPKNAFGSLIAGRVPAFELCFGALDAIKDSDCDAMIFDLQGEHIDGGPQMLELKRAVLEAGNRPVIGLLGLSERSLIRSVLRAGAFDCICACDSMEEVRATLKRAVSYREMLDEICRLRRAETSQHFVSMASSDSKMTEILRLAKKVAGTDATVLLTGESGTGKEVLARAIHGASSRAHEPFIAVACSSLPESLIEAELFGHEKGAFTGASSVRIGRFEAAGGGTILLDEMGELSPALQVKLLRVLQEHSFERLGSNVCRPMKARVICATNSTLHHLIAANTFRQDLFYRISTVEIHLPPLRERSSDILTLANRFLESACERHGTARYRLTPAVMMALQEYEWPGNIRELQNVMERAVLFCEGTEIRLSDIPESVSQNFVSSDQVTFEAEVRRFKRRLIQRVLGEASNNKVLAARMLGIARSSMHRLIDELEVDVTLVAPAARELASKVLRG